MSIKTRRVLLVSLFGLSATVLIAHQSNTSSSRDVRTTPPSGTTHASLPAPTAAPSTIPVSDAVRVADNGHAQTILEQRMAQSWHLDQLMVRANVSLDTLVDRHGGTVRRPAGRSGFGALQVPEGTTLAEYRQRLSADEDVDMVGLQGRTVAASAESDLIDASAEKQAAAAASQVAVAAVTAAQQVLDAAWATLAQLQSMPGTPQGELDDAQAAVLDAQDGLAVAQVVLQQATQRRAAADMDMATVTADFQDALGDVAEVQWHLGATQHPYWIQGQYAWMAPPPRASADIWVAVLDSGLAMDAAGTPLPPSLVETPIVAPRDLVDGDDLPNDEHSHGSHVTGLIAASGASYGIAPGVSIMPVRVLDETNSGTELDLIEGLHHAVAEGADIINLSLTMGPDYVVSPALLDAIQNAADHDVVMVAASGNHAGTSTPWPAASPLVLAVGASMQSQPERWAQQSLAPFSNRGGGVDLAAPSGDLAAPMLGPGLPNGLIAEAFGSEGSNNLGLWAFSGTSQSAALVTGAVALLLERGVAPADVSAVLQRSARYLDWRCPFTGCGAGSLDLQNALTQPISGWDQQGLGSATVSASLLPWVRDEGWQAVAMFDVAVVDDNGQPLANVEVLGRAWADDGATTDLQCRTDWRGTCSIRAFAGQVGQIDGRTYVGQLDTIRAGGVGVHPTPLAFATDGLAVIQAAMAEQAGFADTLVGIHWDANHDPVLGAMRPSYAVMNYGAGLSSSPLGVLIGNNAVSDGIVVSMVNLDLDGAGLSSSPLGFLPTTRMVIDGSGLSSSPLGLLGGNVLELTLLSNAGLSASTLGLGAAGLALPPSRTGGSGLSSSPLGFQGDPILLGTGELVGGPAGGGALADALGDGSWLGGAQVGAGSVLVASGVVASTTEGQSIAARVPVEVE